MPKTFDINTEVYAGPLDLLLHLIEKRKLFISDISLSEVADEYIKYTQEHEHNSLENSSQFILIASTLVLIKSRSLLPNLELTEDEQGNIDELQQRLKLYKMYKELSLDVGERFGRYVMVAPLPRKGVSIETKFSPAEDITFENIRKSIETIFARIPSLDDIPQATVRKIIRLEEVIERLLDRVQKSLQTSFREFTGNAQGSLIEKKQGIIVSFLAMLELVKRGIIEVQQSETFHDIQMETNSINTPRY